MLLHDKLAEWVRVKKGKKAEPSAGIMDSQSVKNTSIAEEEKGFDAGKRGQRLKAEHSHRYSRTAHLCGRPLSWRARQAGACLLLEKAKDRLPKTIFADEGYSGKLIEFVQQTYGWLLLIVTKISGMFNQHKRWTERSFTWINNDRRNSKDYEASPNPQKLSSSALCSNKCLNNFVEPF